MRPSVVVMVYPSPHGETGVSDGLEAPRPAELLLEGFDEALAKTVLPWRVGRDVFLEGGPPAGATASAFSALPPALYVELSSRFQCSCTRISFHARTGFRPTLLPYRFSGGVYTRANSY